MWFKSPPWEGHKSKMFSFGLRYGIQRMLHRWEGKNPFLPMGGKIMHLATVLKSLCNQASEPVASAPRENFSKPPFSLLFPQGNQPVSVWLRCVCGFECPPNRHLFIPTTIFTSILNKMEELSNSLICFLRVFFFFFLSFFFFSLSHLFFP